MAQFNAEIGLKVNSSPAERQVRKVEKAVEKVERASRDILGVDKQIVGERKKLLRLSGEQATRAKKRITNLRLQRTELGLQRRELQGIARLEKQRSKQLNSGSGGGGGGGPNPLLLGAGAAAAARMSPARAFKQGDVVGQLKVDRNRLSDALDAIEDEVRDGTANLQRALTKYRATVNKFGAGSSQAAMSRNVGVRPKVSALRDSKFQQLYASGRLRDVDTTINSISNAQAKFNRQASRAASPINALGKQLLFTAGAYFTLDTAVRALNASARSTAELQRLEIALKAIVGADTPKALNAIARAVDDFNIPLAAATRNFTQLAAAGQANGNSVEELETLYRGLAAATKATGGDAEDLNGVLRAATQVLSKNKVQAEELRGQIGDRLPGAFNLFAEATGRSAQELDKALKDGEVSAAEFVEKFGRFIKEKYEPAAKRIADSPAEAGARLQKALDDLNRSVGPALAELGAKFQDFAAKSLRVLKPLGEYLAKLFNVGQNANTKAYANNQKELLGILKQQEATEKRLEAARAAGQSDFALLGIQETLDSLENKRQILLKKIALQVASLGVNEGSGTPPRVEEDTDLSTFDSTFRDAASEAAAQEEARRIALRDQDQLLERLKLQLDLERSASDQERVINQLLLDQAEIRQSINNKLQDADPLLAGLINREAGLRVDLANNEALGGIFENAGSSMGADLAERLPEAKTELTEVEQLFQSIEQTLAGGITSAIDGLIAGTQTLEESLSNVLRDIGRLLISSAVNSAVGAIPFPGRAAGGPVSAGQPYEVGEQGRELFIPNISGRIIPSDDYEAARAAMGGGRAGVTSTDDAFDQSAQSVSSTTAMLSSRESAAQLQSSLNSSPVRVEVDTVNVGGLDVVTTEQFAAGMQATAAQAQAKVFSDLRNRPAARRQIGL